MPGTSDNNSAGAIATQNVGREFDSSQGAMAELTAEFPDVVRTQNGHGGPVITPKQQAQSAEINGAGI